jgi:D-alanyl-D-alanine carboxypeptidase/D-alanyl-D-alanine-endopeptidase (penicillin-binding protein 4)
VSGARAEPGVAAVSPGVTAPTLATSLWSPRRVRALFDAAAHAANLRRVLAAITAPVSACIEVDGDGGEIAGIHPDRALAGASTQKLLVAAAALGALGPRYRFDTRATTRAALHDGTLSGDLFLVGGGDPVLTTSSTPSTATAPSTSLPRLADAIVAAGVRQIDGEIVADDSRYDRARAVPDWNPVYVSEGDVGALGALIVNGGRSTDGLAAVDPALDAASDLASLLSARGVRVRGGTVDPGQHSPAGTHELASVGSPPLDQIVAEMLTVSNDETAELLTRELGLARARTGSTAAGARVIPQVLAGLGVPVNGLALHDGSGLAPDNRVTCAALAGVVALGNQPNLSAIIGGLPVAGRTGTLVGRFTGTSLNGRLRAKTGHINGAVGLAGIIEPSRASGGAGSVRFAFVANGNFSTAEGETLQDQVGEAIGGYLDAAVVRGLVPAPR